MTDGKPKSKTRQGWFAYERRQDQLAPGPVFARRLVNTLLVALALIVLALMVGIAGYRFIAGFNCIDSLLESSMILGGMGPVKDLPNDSAKMFASINALFSGLILIARPYGNHSFFGFHRVMHKFCGREGS